MAKSKSFFGLRRGSTKSHTYSVLNGQQITKDRVQSVANPKSQKQQFQRAIMATVMAAYSEMKEIEDHAFQGKKKGSENQREFMSKNLVAMRNAFFQYQEDVPTPAQQKYFAVGPKTPTVLPGEWIISNGSLEKTLFFRYIDGNHMLIADKLPSGASITVGAALEALGLKPGMQITFCCINSFAGQRIYQVYKDNYAGYGDWEFGFCRFIVKKDLDLDQVVTPTSTSDPTAQQESLITEVLNVIIDPRTSRSLKGLDFAHSYTTDHFEIDAEVALASAGFDESLTGAIGIITSMVDEDLRSTSKMEVRNVDTLGGILGLTWDYVWDAWRNAGQSLGESDMYLEGGSV